MKISVTAKFNCDETRCSQQLFLQLEPFIRDQNCIGVYETSFEIPDDWQQNGSKLFCSEHKQKVESI